MHCKFKGCNRKRGIVEGYCRIHHGRELLSANEDTTPKSHSNSRGGVTNEDLKALINEKFDGLNAIVQQLQTENLQLSNQVYELEENVDKLTTENSDLRCAINKHFIAQDALNQHGRHVNGRFLNIPEVKLAKGEKEDCITPLIAVAQKMNVSLSEDDIERCHRLGKPRTNGTNRPIICRFSSYRKKKEMMKNKKSLRIPDEEMEHLTPAERKAKLASNPFIVEDLTPFRGHIFKYVKDWNAKEKKFDIVSTDYGQIVVKEKDTNIWHRISSAEDFNKAGIEYDDDEFDELL